MKRKIRGAYPNPSRWTEVWFPRNSGNRWDGFVCVALCLLMILGCGRIDSNEKIEWMRYELASNEPAGLQFRGKIEAERKVIIGTSHFTNLKTVFRGDGSRVSQGDLLLEWDISTLAPQLKLLRKDLADAEKRLVFMRESEALRELLARQEKDLEIGGKIQETEALLHLEKRLVDEKLGSPERVRQVENRLRKLTEIRQMVSGMKEAEKSRDIAGLLDPHPFKIMELQRSIQEIEEKIAASKTVSPITGIVYALQPLVPGPVQSGPLLEIYDPESLMVKGRVWQNEFLRLTVGEPVTIFPDFLTSSGFKGKISRKIPYGQKIREPSSGEDMSQFEVLIDLEETQKSLLRGMSVLIKTGADAGGTKIPAEFVFQDARGPFVWVEGNGSPKKTRITVSDSDAGYLNVDGLRDGETLLKPLSSKPFTSNK